MHDATPLRALCKREQRRGEGDVNGSENTNQTLSHRNVLYSNGAYAYT
jgi:hypothetical protein